MVATPGVPLELLAGRVASRDVLAEDPAVPGLRSTAEFLNLPAGRVLQDVLNQHRVAPLEQRRIGHNVIDALQNAANLAQFSTRLCGNTGPRNRQELLVDHPSVAARRTCKPRPL